MQPFYKAVRRTPSEYFVPNVFNKRNLTEIQDKKSLCLAFNQVQESVSSKNAVRLLNETVSGI